MKEKLQLYLSKLNEDERYEVEERIAIMIFDGGMREDEALKKFFQIKYKEQFFPNYKAYRID